MGPAEILVSGGVAAVLAAVAGGGLKAFGVELPLLATVKRQALVMIVGTGLIALGLMSGAGLLRAPEAGGQGPAQSNAVLPADANSASETPDSPDANASAGKAAKPAPAAAPSAETDAAGAVPGNSAPQGGQGPPPAPDMLGMGFPEARRLIVAGGWSPILQEAAPRENSALGGRGEEIEASSYREAVSCGGANCLLRYRQRGHVLEVVVTGETLESGSVSMYDVLGCNARQRPEGCPSE